jgi:hypothetical protein
MGHVYLPLQGPAGVRPKAPAVGAWQSPGYQGISLADTPEQTWVGLRCDGLVVVDCDTIDAYNRWRTIDQSGESCIRKTPRGYHFVYEATPGAPDAPAADVFGYESHIDIRAGRTSQIVYRAPGYEWLIGGLDSLSPFLPDWLPTTYIERPQLTHDEESWDEMPFGRGNNTMAAFAGAFRKQGMSLRAIAKCLGAINRITMTEDPMPVEMIVEIAKSVSRYAPRPDIDIVVDDA